MNRFDLIYLVLDKADEVMDRRLARHLVGLHYAEPEVRRLCQCPTGWNSCKGHCTTQSQR